MIVNSVFIIIMLDRYHAVWIMFAAVMYIVANQFMFGNYDTFEIGVFVIGVTLLIIFQFLNYFVLVQLTKIMLQQNQEVVKTYLKMEAKQTAFKEMQVIFNNLEEGIL